ncbi:MAG: Crp/Fnr family transcriptional regulator [Bacteroides thetaiotaomicron]|uniref:Crp/Fnr family transcriptional regulator n=1 Tax=Bacteroides thetaiotaomicron TaxID=818 RepID=A0A943DR79_BACT4|nr:Crp/Fnr family transcriptional regulator [Bacteroides thetaiotaomicron]
MKSFNTYLENLDMNFLRNLCVENGKLFHYNKGDYFCRISDKKSLFGFIETGSFKYTITNYKGEERITGFVFDNTPVGDALNIVTNSQIRTDIIALTKSKVFVCNGSILTDILRQNPIFHTKIAIGLLAQTYDRFLDLSQKSPKERYSDLLAKCPEILHKVSLKELASYLQVTPTYLSRIRKEITFDNKVSL